MLVVSATRWSRARRHQGQLEGSGHAFVVFATKAAASAAKVKYRGLTVHSLVSFSGKELADKQLQFLYGPEAKSRQFKGRLRDATADGDEWVCPRGSARGSPYVCRR